MTKQDTKVCTKKVAKKKLHPLKIGRLYWFKISDSVGFVAVSRGFKPEHVDRHISNEDIEKNIGITYKKLDELCGGNSMSDEMEKVIIDYGFKRRADLDRIAPYGTCYGVCFEKIK